ncbi:MAG TPA: hypothetical protein VFQ66_02850 [Candidatus Limnocylindria bacterium]|nr:hypothetical protein [Candidatus Limnocylindria bacterium]
MNVPAVHGRRACAALVLLSLMIACAPRATSGLPVSCDAFSGGQAGTETQLRFVEATDTQVVLTFGASATSNDFGVPAFALELLEGSNAPRSYRLHVNGTSSLNPDGTSSYTGQRTIEPGGRTVRNISFVDETARRVVFSIALERQACPHVASKTYVYGKSPRAQIVLTFGGSSSLTLETISDAVGGAPIGTAAQASGVGYAPSAKIRITIGGRAVWDTSANADGTFDSGFWIPDREPGPYTVTATDGQGHVGTTTLRIMAARYPK